MKKLSLLILLSIACVCSFLFASKIDVSRDKLKVYDDITYELLYSTSDYQDIATTLYAIGVRFEEWQAAIPLSTNASEEDIKKAYHADISRLMQENNYQSVDVVRILPDNPQKVALREKFLNEHTHSEDEVRFFVEGSGLFYLHVNGKVYRVLCEQGDLISIPLLYAHWFDMGTEPFFTAIRFFTTKEGWVANFTGSDLSQKID